MTQPQPPTGIEVAPPPVVPYRYGLLSVATFDEEQPNNRWEAHGLVYGSDGCGPSGGVWPSPCPPDNSGPAAYRVGFVRNAAGLFTMTLLERSATCPGPVQVTIDGGSPNDLPDVGSTAQEAARGPGRQTTIVVTAGTPGGTDPCDCQTQQTFVVPDAAVNWTFEMTCPPTAALGATAVKIIRDGTEFVRGDPFLVYESARCLALGMPEAGPRARRRLALHEQHYVESTIAATTLRGQMLAVNNGGFLPLVRAFSELEDYIADIFGGLGVIHVPRHVYGYLVAARLIERDGLKLRTTLDNLVAVGAGYPGLGPDGVAPPATQTYLYATGPVKAWRSDVQVREEFDPQRNTRLAIAERSFAFTFDCLRVSALAQL